MVLQPQIPDLSVHRFALGLSQYLAGMLVSY